MERSLTVRGLALIALTVLGGLWQGSVAAEPSGLHLIQSAIGLGAAADGSPIEAKTFYNNEDIQFYTKIAVDPAARASGEIHRLLYKWYTGDVVSLSFPGQKRFDVSPSSWWAFVHVSHLNAGHHRAELYVDDQLFASAEFDIKAGARPHEPEEDTAAKDSAIALLMAGDIRHFDELASQYRSSEGRTASGTWKLSLLYNAIDGRSFAPTDPHWKELEDLAAAWLAKEPDSLTAVVLRARFFYSHAWSWRGEGSDGNLPEQNRQAYQQLIQQAREVLDQHPQVAQQDLEWDTLNIAIALEQGASSNEILGIADRALTRWPCFYAIHNAATRAMLPQWGGSRQDIQAYVKMALEHSRSREGTQAYARIYYYIARSSTGKVLEDLNLLGAKWPPLRQSMAEILQKYPSSFNRDIARQMAYFAGDAVAYRAYGKETAGGFIPIAWWDSLKWRQQCDAWAFEGKVQPSSLLSRASIYWSFLAGEGSEFWNPLRWAAYLLILFLEAGFFLLDRFGRRTSQWTLAQGATAALNSFEYPRTYFLMPVLNRFALRLGIWMSVLGAASAYLLTTAPGTQTQETEVVMIGLILIAAAGALIVLNIITARVTLRADGLELRRIVGTKTIRRSDIRSVRCEELKPGLLVFEVVPQTAAVGPLRIPPVIGADDTFRLWFESLRAPHRDTGNSRSSTLALRVPARH